MNVFDLDRALVGDYERFARSFTKIRAPDTGHVSDEAEGKEMTVARARFKKTPTSTSAGSGGQIDRGLS